MADLMFRLAVFRHKVLPVDDVGQFDGGLIQLAHCPQVVYVLLRVLWLQLRAQQRQS